MNIQIYIGKASTMKLKINNALEYILFCIITSLFIFPFSISIESITLLAIIQCIFFCCLVYKIYKTVLNVGIIFIVLSLTFHFGHQIIYTLHMNDVYSHINLMNITSVEQVLTASIYSLLCHIFFSAGYLLLANKTSRYNPKLLLDINGLKKIRLLFIIVFIISFIPMVYSDIDKLIALFSGGYINTFDTYKVGINKYIYLLSIFARPSYSVILFSYYKNPKIAKKLYLCSIIYSLFMMLSGDRGNSMIYILVWTFIYFKYISSLNKKSFILLILSGFFINVFMQIIMVIRSMGTISVEAVSEALLLRSDSNYLYLLLRENGLTLKSLIYCMQFIPQNVGYAFGKTFLYSILGASPVLPDFLLNFISNDITFFKNFPEAFQFSLGGTYIGEFYYNFGWFGPVMIIIIGLIVAKLDIILNNIITKKGLLSFILTISLLPKLFMYIRGFAYELLIVPTMIFIVYKIGIRKR